MRKFMLLLLPLAVAVVAANASNPVSLGYSTETTISEPDTRACSSGALHYNHNGSFENGYAWQYDGVVPPYYGCFGEAYDLGAVTVHCGAYWLTQIGYFTGQRADCYVWEGGVTRPPGAVVGVVTGVLFSGIAYWPSISQHDVDLNIDVTGEFTVGYWGNWPGSGPCGWYVAADLDGEQGHPWTNIAPGIGYPTGWQDPSIVWGYTPALGIGVWAGLSAAACCQGDVCTISTESECTGLGGEWHPDCASCDPNPCIARVCCTDGVCSIVPEHECTGIDAEWHSEWTSCDPNPCPPPSVRACCLLEECALLTRSVCQATGGYWHPDWETCNPNPCPLCADYAGTVEIVGSVDTPGNAYGVAVTGNHAYVADYWAGLQVIDISDPQSPQIVGTVNTPGGAIVVAVSGAYAYVADYEAGLQVIDISDPSRPHIVGTADTPDHAYSVVVAANHAYVADYGSGLQVIDISNPQNPHIVGTANTPGNAVGVAVSGTHAYVGDWGAGLQVVDISDPLNPQIVGSIDTPGGAYGLAVSDTYAYVADYGSGLQVIDISNPQDPQIVGTVDTPGDAYGVVVAGNYAYLADYYSGLQVIDIHDPQSPQAVGTFDTSGCVAGAAVSKYVFVADWDCGMHILPPQCDAYLPGETGLNAIPLTGGGTLEGDLSDYANDYDPGNGGCTGQSAEGNDIVYLISADPGFTIDVIYVQAGGDASLYLVTNYNDLGTCVAGADAAGVGEEEHLQYVVPTTRSSYYLIADGHGSGGGPFTLTYSIANPSAVGDSRSVAGAILWTPNPYHCGEPIRFHSPVGSSQVDLGVYDVQGRLLRTLLHQTVDPGRHEIEWDGRTASGAAAPAGLYYLRGSLGAKRLSRGLLLVR